MWGTEETAERTPDPYGHRYKELFHCCMIYQETSDGLLTDMLFLYNACFPPLKMDIFRTDDSAQQRAGSLSKMNVIHIQYVLHCA